MGHLPHKLLTYRIGRCRDRLHPSVHLSQNKVEALLGIGLVIQDEFSLQIVQLEEFDAHLVTVSHQDRLGLQLAMLLLVLLYFGEESLQGIDERLEHVGPSVSHLTEGLQTCPQGRKDPNRLQRHI